MTDTNEQRELDEILDNFFTVGTERHVSELEHQLIQWGKRQRASELKRLDDKIWFTAEDVQNILDSRIAELTKEGEQ